ncbi:MAG: barstar family protein [Pyrinomonadaceae bacterium]
MAKARLETEGIFDWDSFHLKCKEEFCFPDFYGKNMNAWIDCLTYLRDGDGMSRFQVSDDEMLHIEITHTRRFLERVPEIFDALVECSASVNFRYAEPVIALVFTDTDT